RMSVELSEQFFAKASGWEAMKMARAYVQNDQVLSSDWSPPLLKGVVQAGGTSYRAGFVIKSATDFENICTCRESREWGTLCAHSVGVGLHYLTMRVGSPSPPSGERVGVRWEPVRSPYATAAPLKSAGATLQRSETGAPLE